ncbi:hypothetical protein AVEN_29418-1 [Araneus ventricosus]|uniref:Uncharacterized protein n=1 Tax=Araneus ventricosus TaxID=182803 RepID=A0A4Y2CYU4_ARAVE|nr:hypothetical protein AVEN_29418-1 [Araneus ventricosus]
MFSLVENRLRRRHLPKPSLLPFWKKSHSKHHLPRQVSATAAGRFVAQRRLTQSRDNLFVAGDALDSTTRCMLYAKLPSHVKLIVFKDRIYTKKKKCDCTKLLFSDVISKQKPINSIPENTARAKVVTHRKRT